jgi:hypothetical protein
VKLGLQVRKVKSVLLAQQVIKAIKETLDLLDRKVFKAFKVNKAFMVQLDPQDRKAFKAKLGLLVLLVQRQLKLVLLALLVRKVFKVIMVLLAHKVLKVHKDLSGLLDRKAI